MVTDYNFVI